MPSIWSANGQRKLAKETEAAPEEEENSGECVITAVKWGKHPKEEMVMCCSIKENQVDLAMLNVT